MDPHTTQKKGRSCESCHTNPKSLGLGQGSILLRNGKLNFVPSLSESPNLLGIDQPLDSMVNIEGKPLMHTSRPYFDTFSKNEIYKILKVGLCLTCHEGEDSIMKNWLANRKQPEPCQQYNLLKDKLSFSKLKRP